MKRNDMIEDSDESKKIVNTREGINEDEKVLYHDADHLNEKYGNEEKYADGGLGEKRYDRDYLYEEKEDEEYKRVKEAYERENDAIHGKSGLRGNDEIYDVNSMKNKYKNGSYDSEYDRDGKKYQDVVNRNLYDGYKKNPSKYGARTQEHDYKKGLDEYTYEFSLKTPSTQNSYVKKNNMPNKNMYIDPRNGGYYQSNDYLYKNNVNGYRGNPYPMNPNMRYPSMPPPNMRIYSEMNHYHPHDVRRRISEHNYQQNIQRLRENEAVYYNNGYPVKNGPSRSFTIDDPNPNYNQMYSNNYKNEHDEYGFVDNNYDKKRKAKVRICSNCETRNTPSWRRSIDGKKLLCNACGLYQKLHGRNRPYQVTTEGKTKAVKQIADRIKCFNCNTYESSFWRTIEGRSVCNHCSKYLKDKMMYERGNKDLTGEYRDEKKTSHEDYLYKNQAPSVYGDEEGDVRKYDDYPKDYLKGYSNQYDLYPTERERHCYDETKNNDDYETECYNNYGDRFDKYGHEIEKKDKNDKKLNEDESNERCN